MDSDILDNFAQRVFYHGTSADAAASIAESGFRVWFGDGDQRYPSGGNLGNGLYITCNLRTALCFGPALLRVAVRPGTKFLNATLPLDAKTLDSLRREFGREILRKSPWKVLPQNKKLKLGELINLFRYHYRRTWERDFGTDRDGFPRWRKQRELHGRLLSDFRNVLVRYGFHGYGNPEDDNGIVVFAEDRLALQEIIAHIPSNDYWTLLQSEFRELQTVEQVQARFPRRGTASADG